MACQRPLSRNGAGHGVSCGCKNDEKRVAFCAHFVTAVRGDRVTHEALVIALDLSIALAKLVKELGRSFDVGEQKRNGARRRLAHSGFSPSM
jgi:hypothetical protein